MTDQCPFCQLISQPEQLNIIGETENFYAWLEYPQPRAKGHANIVPKEHVEDVMELSFSQFQEGIKLTREVMEKAMEGLGADGLSVTMNVKEAGGQMLPHAYIQVFPRFQDEENAGTPTGAIFPHREELQTEEAYQKVMQGYESVDIDLGSEAFEPHPDSQRHKEENNRSRKDEASNNESESSESESSSESSSEDSSSEGESDSGYEGYKRDDEESKTERSYRKRGESTRWT
ncbi:MAG: HIT family protein [Candidatus Nanohaloarchaea archaeon]